MDHIAALLSSHHLFNKHHVTLDLRLRTAAIYSTQHQMYDYMCYEKFHRNRCKFRNDDISIETILNKLS